MTDNIIFTRRKNFLFLAIIPSALFLSFVILAQSWQQEVHQTNAMQSYLNNAYHMFYGELYEEAKIIKVLSEQLSQSKEIQDAFVDGDREGLLEKSRDYFQKIKNEYDITHLYFHSIDKKVFLRAHFPDLSGDSINRFTLDEAEREGNVSYGIELGTMGTLTLRVVLPWRVGDKIIGYLELGKDVVHVVKEMKKILEVDILLVVNKEHLGEELGTDKYGRKKTSLSVRPIPKIRRGLLKITCSQVLEPGQSCVSFPENNLFSLPL